MADKIDRSNQDQKGMLSWVFGIAWLISEAYILSVYFFHQFDSPRNDLVSSGKIQQAKDKLVMVSNSSLSTKWFMYCWVAMTCCGEFHVTL